MTYTTLISVSELFRHITNPDWAIIDCRFSLDDAERGHRDYLQAHIPGAVYAHLNEDLSGRAVPGKTGRHPLPGPKTFAQTLSNWGIDDNVQVVAYDNKGGAMAAARLWWMLRWAGHHAVAVLNGGWSTWLKHNCPVTSSVKTRAQRNFISRIQNDFVLSSEDVVKILHDQNFRLIDSRSADRYRGENETVDPVAGHIPGALSVPFAGNLDADSLFLSRKDLKTRFRLALGDMPPERAVFYCGSGVTAAHNLLALKHAGLGNACLYAGSWSEWITNPDNPVTTGSKCESQYERDVYKAQQT
ncbi:MAG: sulfurtransferase [Candidatus Brocadia sp.]|nr:sulfurtransferase [Candidatus Brocadia sp.]MDG6027813.1 sulfurtransferase [Candidatus Brocadia sp.]